jgi:hypothetical protein
MGKVIQRPLACRNAHCGAMCSPAEASFFRGDPSKCWNYERRDDLYRKTEILDKVKQARKEIANKHDDPAMSWEEKDYGRNEMIDEVLEILDRLIESEEI